jgi:hypothetical protein
MSIFEVVFVRADGLDEKEIQFRQLSAGTVDEAVAEARSLITPNGANLIKILAECHLARRIGIDL